MVSRREFLNTLLAAGLGASAIPDPFGLSASTRAIDRFALVTRHNPRLEKIDPLGISGGRKLDG